MISKEKYVLAGIKVYVNHKFESNKPIQPSILKSLIDQWEFDYEMDKEYRPEVLTIKGEC